MPTPQSRWSTVEFEPREADRGTWLRMHAFRRIRHAERDPDDPFTPDDVVEAQMRKPWHRYDAQRWLATQDGLIVANGSVSLVKPGSPEYDSNKHLAWGSCSVCQSYRRQGIFGAILDHMRQRMDRSEARILNLAACSAEPDGAAALEAIGAERKLTERESRLRFADVDWQEMESWVEDVERRAPGHRLELWAERVPREIFEEYAAARSEMMNLMPFEDLEHGEIVITSEDLQEQNERLALDQAEHHTYVARDPTDRIVGITDVRWSPSAPRTVSQWFTGVHPDARGKGLGKAIKAAMAIELKDRYDPDWMDTGNSQTNAAMLAINEAMGFQPYREWQDYQIDSATLARYLDGG